jgi:MFS family permease
VPEKQAAQVPRAHAQRVAEIVDGVLVEESPVDEAERARDRRRCASPCRRPSVTLVLQLVGVSLLARGGSAATLYAGCVLFGLGVGNLTTLPGLIVAVEWPRERFAALIGLVVAINQFTFAFGPSLVGVVHDWSGRYSTALGVCMGLQALAATLVLVGARRQRL